MKLWSGNEQAEENPALAQSDLLVVVDVALIDLVKILPINHMYIYIILSVLLFQNFKDPFLFV